MTLEQIIKALEEGAPVHWCNSGYTVVKDDLGQLLIVHQSGDTVGLHGKDGRLNGKPSDFYVPVFDIIEYYKHKGDVLCLYRLVKYRNGEQRYQFRDSAGQWVNSFSYYQNNAKQRLITITEDEYLELIKHA